MQAVQISSLHNPRIKTALRLRERRGRERQQRIILDGVREIERALEAGVEFDELFVCQPLDARAAKLIARVEVRHARVLTVSADVMKKLAFGQRNEGLVATARLPRSDLQTLHLPPQPLVAVLEHVEKPGNVGAVLRSADAAGAAAVILADPVTDLFNPNVIRASLGAVFTVPCCTASAAETRTWCRSHGLQLLAARVDGAVDYTEVDLTLPTALILGSETEGLSDRWAGENVTAVSLPMHGRVDSLNVSATAAVLFYESQRQRRLLRPQPPAQPS